jgi:TATA-box binding protein (TBP) (component of TFIID and TFIIIB)
MSLRVTKKVVEDIKGMLEDSTTHKTRMAKHDATLSAISPTDFDVSTMTVVVHLSIANSIRIDLYDLVNWIEDPDNVIYTNHMGHLLDTENSKKKKNTDETFYNQITLRVIDAYGKKAVKIFVNGVLHITGAKTIKDAVAIAHTICVMLEQALELPDVLITELRVCMINTNFCTNVHLRLTEVKRLLTAEMNTPCSYDPEGYPGAGFKHKNVSIFIFATGKIIITGGKSFDDIFVGYQFVTSFLNANIQRLKSQPFMFTV